MRDKSFRGVMEARWIKQQEKKERFRLASVQPISGPSEEVRDKGPLILPWPPSGNTAVRHANGKHYVTPEVLDYRETVKELCAPYEPVKGRYRLHVHLSPPDFRRRDADNVLKVLLDALVKAGYLADDSLNYMRELAVTTDDDRKGRVRVTTLKPWTEPEAA